MDELLRLLGITRRIGISKVSDLRKVVGRTFLNVKDMAFVLGKNTLNDGNACEYYWNENSSVPDNGDTVIMPTEILANQPGRWIKVNKSTSTGGGGGGGGTVTLPRVLSRTFIGNGTLKTASYQHDWNKRNVIVTVYEDNAGLTTLPNIGVDANINIFNDAVRLTFTNPPATGKKYLILIQEVLI